MKKPTQIIILENKQWEDDKNNISMDKMLEFMMLQSKRAWKTTFRTTLHVVEEGVNEIAKWEKTTGRKKGK